MAVWQCDRRAGFIEFILENMVVPFLEAFITMHIGAVDGFSMIAFRVLEEAVSLVTCHRHVLLPTVFSLPLSSL